jgi:hypothetical protein
VDVSSCRIAKQSAIWCYPVRSHHHCSCVHEWSTESVLYCSRMSAHHVTLNGAACRHVTMALMVTTSFVRCVRIGNALALMTIVALSGVCIMGTYDTSYRARPATHFFILDFYDPQRPMGRVAAVEPSSAGRRGPESWNM